MPIMLFKNLNRIKIMGVIITVLNLTLIIQAAGYYIYDAVYDSEHGEEQKHIKPKAWPADYASAYPFSPKISFAFEY